MIDPKTLKVGDIVTLYAMEPTGEGVDLIGRKAELVRILPHFHQFRMLKGNYMQCQTVLELRTSLNLPEIRESRPKPAPLKKPSKQKRKVS